MIFLPIKFDRRDFSWSFFDEGIGKYDSEWLQEQIEVAIKKLNDEEQQDEAKKDWWILGRGVDPALMPFTINSGYKLNQLQTINIQWEGWNETTNSRPVLMMSASMHTIYINQTALEKIKEKFPDEEQMLDDSNGVLQEIPQMTPALYTIPSDQVKKMMAENLDKNMGSIFQQALSRGVTLLYDAAMEYDYKVDPYDLDPEDGTSMYRKVKEYIDAHPEFPRIGCAVLYENPEDPFYNFVLFDKKELEKDLLNSQLYIGHVKMISDGSNQGLTGYQTKPYDCGCPYCLPSRDEGCPPPDENLLSDSLLSCRGFFNYPYGKQKQPNNLINAGMFPNMLLNIIDKKWSVMIHANGDKAIDLTLAGFKLAESKKQEGVSYRNRIEHCSLLVVNEDRNDIERMKKFSVSPSFLIGHVGYWGLAFKEAILEDRAQMLDLCKSSIKENVRITLHSDIEVTPLGPLRLMEQAITRRMEENQNQVIENGVIKEEIPLDEQPPLVLNKNESLTAGEALRAVTYDAAWQCHAEKYLGSLEAEKLADFVILEENPLTMKDIYKKMRHIKVYQTWKGGVKVYPPKSEQIASK